MKTGVTYRSTSGFTEKYAQWLAEELRADLFPVKKARAALLPSYDRLVFGGSLHAVGICGIGIIKKNPHRLQGKKLVVFTVGASPPREGIPAEILNRNFTD